MTIPPSPSTESSTQPVLFIPHGAGPCFFMDWKPTGTWDQMADYLRSVATALPARPRAILMVSAHWLTDDFQVTAPPHPELIYDYFGFPESTYALEYPAPGSPDVAERVTALLSAAGLDCQQEPERGLDHGAFIPLKLMFPEADIPVVQLSLRRNLDPAVHLAAGEALAKLRDEGVLIVGSGMSFHNMRGYGDARYTAPSVVFDDWLTQAVQSDPQQRKTALANWSEAPQAYQCHPAGHEEHLLPLMVVAGAAGEDRGRKVYTQQVLKTQLSAFHFG